MHLFPFAQQYGWNFHEFNKLLDQNLSFLYIKDSNCRDLMRIVLFVCFLFVLLCLVFLQSYKTEWQTFVTNTFQLKMDMPVWGYFFFFRFGFRSIILWVSDCKCRNSNLYIDLWGPFNFRKIFIRIPFEI